MGAHSFAAPANEDEVAEPVASGSVFKCGEFQTSLGSILTGKNEQISRLILLDPNLNRNAAICKHCKNIFLL